VADPIKFLRGYFQWLVLVVFALLILGYKQMTTEPINYCHEQSRTITDEEIFINYLDRRIAGRALKLGAKETSGRDYLTNHPRCCYLDWSWKARLQGGGFFDALFNDYGILSIRFEITSEEKNRRRAANASAGAVAYVNHCGRIWNHSVMTD
jgi:hypothetical protein